MRSAEGAGVHDLADDFARAGLVFGQDEDFMLLAAFAVAAARADREGLSKNSLEVPGGCAFRIVVSSHEHQS
jgi:hypothetical protein